jgi:hypothetical protein
VPVREAIDPLLAGSIVPPSTFLVRQRPTLPLQRFPDPACLPLVLDVMPHRIAFQDHALPRGVWLLIGCFGTCANLVADRLGRDPQEQGDAVHRPTTQGPQHGGDLRVIGLLRGVVRGN